MCWVQVAWARGVMDAFEGGEVEGRCSLVQMMSEAERLRESQDLFGLPVADYHPLTRCQVRLRACTLLRATHIHATLRVSGSASLIVQVHTATHAASCYVQLILYGEEKRQPDMEHHSVLNKLS